MKLGAATTLVALVLASLAGCTQPSAPPVANTPTAPVSPPAFRPPTATEAFHLQSECVALGEKILNESIHGRALSASQLSKYDPKTNRCYVALTVETADLDKYREIYHHYLYDGQTKDLLGWASIDHGQKGGTIRSRPDLKAFDDVDSYIDGLTETL